MAAVNRGQGLSLCGAAYPGRELSVAELRAKHPDPELARLSLARVVEKYAALLRRCEERPILVTIRWVASSFNCRLINRKPAGRREGGDSGFTAGHRRLAANAATHDVLLLWNRRQRADLLDFGDQPGSDLRVSLFQESLAQGTHFQGTIAAFLDLTLALNQGHVGLQEMCWCSW